MAMNDSAPVIVGAGPAGTRAAATLAAAGLAPIVVDEAPQSGGQIFRRAPPGFTRTYRALYGFDAANAQRVHDAFDALGKRIDYRPGTLVWDLRDGFMHCLAEGRSHELAYRDVILAPGARDRIIPFPGWTLPGVYALGAAQVALKYQGCAIGERVAFMGSGPLLYLVAYQYAKAGGDVAAVLDTAPFAAKRRALPGLLRGGSTFAKGLWYVARLRARGIHLENAIRPVSVEEKHGAVSAFIYRDAAGAERRLACDALAFGFGLSSETQLADLAGIPFAFDAVQQQFLPQRDIAGRTPIRGVYLAGDGCGIAGAHAAELSGERAALALLEDRGLDAPKARVATLERALARIDRFRVALATAFPFPVELAAQMADDTIVCRCEAIRAGELRHAARELDGGEINRAKAFSRCGMGRCQGRMCGPSAAVVLASALGVPLEDAGRLRGQPPVKPIPMTAAT
jgi:NADPH-dependent 2,4-dienoyl-CoA reductase/sulfur reductase-like enzyme